MVNAIPALSKFKRNDKVYVLESYTSRPKFSLVVKVPLGQLLVIEKVDEPDSFFDFWWYKCNTHGPTCGYPLPIPENYLYKYTKLGELIYG